MNVEYIFEKYFNGNKNIFTPFTYGFDKIHFGNEVLLVEKSKGEGLFEKELFGIVFLVLNLEDNTVQRIDLDKPFYSKKEAENYVKSITFEIFKNAHRYGEIKIITF